MHRSKARRQANSDQETSGKVERIPIGIASKSFGAFVVSDGRRFRQNCYLMSNTPESTEPSADPRLPAGSKPRGTKRNADGSLRYSATGPAPRTGLSALPSATARILAFVSILAGGAIGAVIGYGVTKVSSADASSTALGVGALLGALFFAGGIAVVAVLVLRAMGEWRALDRPLPPATPKQ